MELMMLTNNSVEEIVEEVMKPGILKSFLEKFLIKSK